MVTGESLSENSIHQNSECLEGRASSTKYRRELNYPDNDQLCKEAVWFTQNLLLGSRRDMNDIANAILKTYENREKLAQLDKTSSKYKKDSVAL